MHSTAILVSALSFCKIYAKSQLKYVQVGAYYLQHARISSRCEKGNGGAYSLALTLAMALMTEFEWIEKQRKAVL